MGRTWKGSEQVSEGHSPPEEQRDGLVRTWKGSKQTRDTHDLVSAKGWAGHGKEATERVRGTHPLKNTEGWTSQDIEGK
jgi:hypothetical protein